MSTFSLLRSLFAVPMDQPERLAQALDSDADGLMLDLTDLVAAHRKAEARANLREFLAAGAGPAGSGPHLWVRIARTGEDEAVAANLDVAAAVGVTGLIIPECFYPSEVRKIAGLLDEFEARRGLTAGAIRLLPLPEGALAIRNYFETLTASERVCAAWFPGAPRGDLCRDVGFQWTSEGTERLYMRSKVVLDARAAGIEHIIDSGPGQLLDAPAFEADVRGSQRLGFTGRMAYSSAQAEIINRVFTPSPAEVEAAQAEIAAYEQALGQGLGLFELGGRIVDVTTVKHARRVVAKAAAAGMATAPGSQQGGQA
jgi:citrate lyase subunit beta / citryl-CoA lyase